MGGVAHAGAERIRGREREKKKWHGHKHHSPKARQKSRKASWA